jgi:hypothetical protein
MFQTPCAHVLFPPFATLGTIVRAASRVLAVLQVGHTVVSSRTRRTAGPKSAIPVSCDRSN